MKGRLSEEFRGRTKAFAAGIIRLFVKLPKNREEVRVLGKQLLRSGTSVAAHLAREIVQWFTSMCFVRFLTGCFIPVALVIYAPELHSTIPAKFHLQKTVGHWNWFTTRRVWMKRMRSDVKSIWRQPTASAISKPDAAIISQAKRGLTGAVGRRVRFQTGRRIAGGWRVIALVGIAPWRMWNRVRIDQAVGRWVFRTDGHFHHDDQSNQTKADNRKLKTEMNFSFLFSKFVLWL